MNDEKSAAVVSEAYYRTLVEISPDAILVIHQDGSIIESNAKAMMFFGLENDTSRKGQSVFDIVHPDDHARAKADIGTVCLNEELHDVEYSMQKKDGTILWASVSAKLIPSLTAEDPKNILILIRDISKRKITEETLHNLAVTDDLTGLYNRRGFSLAAEQEIRHAFRRKEGLVLLFCDVDNLKKINDTFGHAEGDNALNAATLALRSTFRESDIVARWGGDEFIVLALDVPEGRVPILLQRLHQVLQKFNLNPTIAYEISFSTGIAHYNPATPSSLAEMEKIADKMMYREKQEKKLALKTIFKFTS